MAEEIGKFSREHVSTTYTEDEDGNIDILDVVSVVSFILGN